MEERQLKVILGNILEKHGKRNFTLVSPNPEPYDEKAPLSVEDPDILLYVRGSSDVFGLHVTRQI